MSKTCVNHPEKEVFVYDPFCESIWCKDCYEMMDKIYQESYKKQRDLWNAIEIDKD